MTQATLKRVIKAEFGQETRSAKEDGLTSVRPGAICWSVIGPAAFSDCVMRPFLIMPMRSTSAIM